MNPPLNLQVHRERLYHLCLSIVHDESLADDITQQALLTAYQRIQQLRDSTRFTPWLNRIAKNLCFTALKERKNLSLRQELLSAAAPTSALKRDDEEIEALYRAVESLPSKYRAVFELHEIANYSHKQISQLLHIKEGTSRSRLHHAKKEIKKCVLSKKGKIGNAEGGSIPP